MSDQRINGTAVKDEETGTVEQTTTLERELTAEQKQAVEKANGLIGEAYALLSEVFTAPQPVGNVQWVHASEVVANDYNPNSVAHQEMRLLHTSISSDGYTQPVVAIRNENTGKYEIVDGYHRYTVMRKYADISSTTGGYLPLVVIDKPIADRIASTVRHNRARGKHSVQGMSNLVFQMLEAGENDVTICHKLGLEAEELARLKHITGYSKLYANAGPYSTVQLNSSQTLAKAKYAKDHPDETIPEF